MNKYPFKLIANQGENGLIEVLRGGETTRCILPMVMLRGKDVSDAEIDLGIPFGLPFSQFLQANPFIPEIVEVKLHNAGIWTLDDLRQNAQKAVRIIQSVYHIELASIIKSAEDFVARPNETKVPKPVQTPSPTKIKTGKKEKMK